MSDVLLREITDGVAVLTLNRPDRLNAWTNELEDAYFDALEESVADDAVRVIVVTGAGKGFCAGFDMGELQAMSSGDVEGEQNLKGSDPFIERRPQTTPLTIGKPIIAAVNGACAGLGLVQALMADIRFAAAGAKFTTAFARRGLIAEHGISWILPRLVGPARALDLLMSGRVFLAEEAAELGVVNRVVAPEVLMDETLAYARDLAANCSPASMAAMKAQVYRALEQPLPDALDEANRLMLESFGRPDFAEGVTSFVERRPPAFAPLGPSASSR